MRLYSCGVRTRCRERACAMEGEFIKFKLSIETHLLPPERTAADLDTSERKNIYGLVVTLWGKNSQFLKSLETHATNTLTRIINNATIAKTHVSRRRFSDTDCSVEVSAVPIVSNELDATDLNHEIVKLFVNGVLEDGYTFHGIRIIQPSMQVALRFDVLRVEIAIKRDADVASGPTGGEDEGDEDDDGDDPVLPVLLRRRKDARVARNQIKKQLKDKRKKQKEDLPRGNGTNQEESSSSSDAQPRPDTPPATTNLDDVVTSNDLFGSDSDPDEAVTSQDLFGSDSDPDEDDEMYGP